MDNTNPRGDQITSQIGDNAHNVAIGKEITQTNATVTSSGDHRVATGGSVSDSVIVTGDNNQVYVTGRKTGPPLHYPPRAEHFVGRKDELKKLLADLHPGHIGDRHGEGNWLGRLAGVYRQLGQLDVALTHAKQGLQIARKIHNPLSEAYWLWELGRIYRAWDDSTQALTYLQQALVLFEEVKSPQAAVRSQLDGWEKEA